MIGFCCVLVVDVLDISRVVQCRKVTNYLCLAIAIDGATNTMPRRVGIQHVQRTTWSHSNPRECFPRSRLSPAGISLPQGIVLQT